MDISLVDPELHNAVRKMPRVPYRSGLGRGLIQVLLGLARAPKVEGVEIEVVDELKPPVRLYVPKVRRSDAAILWIHGGGFIIGRAAQDDRLCAMTARELGVTVVSADYRVAPKSPFPGPLDDCHQAWTWLQRSASRLGVDASRIVIGGQSAGGGLAATLVQRLHDLGEAVLAQWLFSPMLDDRTAADRALDGLDHRIWNNSLNAFGWRAFLGREPGGEVPPYAAAARREDLSGLPPTWIGVGEIDLFLDEDRRYAERLKAAGVDVVMTTVPGAPHGFEAWAPDTAIARNFIAAAQAWLRPIVESGARG